MDKIKALAAYLEISEDKITESEGNDYRVLDCFEVDDEEQSEWFVSNDLDEVEEAVKADVQSLLDDCGITQFNVNPEWYVDVNWFEEACREDCEYYIEDIKTEPANSDKYETRFEEEMAESGCDTEESFVEYLYDSWTGGDPVEWYIDNFGQDAFDKVCEKNDLIDVDELADHVYNMDGAGMLATWDGQEIEFEFEGDTYYFYRVG